ncbi:hypothetical protein FIU93_14525 [Labrenzia sp. THAF35]|nr:hypothetical protein FIU93_14525 [Labrenzia sp. THAF35]
MEKIVAIDASEISPIMKNFGLEGLIATAKRGDLFFYSNDFEQELERARFFETKNGTLFRDWIRDQRNPPPGYTPDVRIVEIDDVLDEEKNDYDPNRKRLTKKGGFETWDMSIRKRMKKHPDFDYEIISREKDFFENKNKNIYDPVTKKHAKIVDVPFRYTSVKKLASELVVDPTLNLSREQYENIYRFKDTRFGEVKGLDQGQIFFPETYEEVLRQRGMRAKPKGAPLPEVTGQLGGRMSVLPDEAARPVPMLSSGMPVDDLSGAQLGQNSGISSKATGSLWDEATISRRFMKLARRGAPVFVLGLAAVPVFSMVQARADERNIPFAQAARELGLEFTEDDLKSMAAEAGLDLAVSLTPVGPLKKAWDVLGNLDDIIALTQLYGEAYPDNLVIRKMAEIATTVEGSEAFGAYVYGRDALTGAVGSAIDWAFAGSEDEEEALQSLQGIQNALEAGGAVEQAANRGATREELTETLTRDAELHRGQVRQLLSAAPVAATDAPLTAPRLEDGSLSSETILMDGGQVPLGEKPVLPGSSAILAPGFEEARQNGVSEGSVSGAGAVGAEVGTGKLDGVSATTAADVADASAGLAASADLARKSSYDRYRQIGRTAAEEAEALADYERLFRQSYVELGGHKEAARDYAIYRFKQMWGLSAFAPEAAGTVLKYPVETAYPDLEKDGHGYVRKDVEDLLKAQGVRAAKWHLMPNDKTGRDRQQAPADEDGYGPRMTLTYDDETGKRHLLTEDFQANVGRVRDRAWQAHIPNNSRRAARQAPAAPAGNVPAALAAAAPGKAAPLDGASTGAR